MDLIRSLAIAFSMYSRVPVPQVEWSERSMKYTFLFFPADPAYCCCSPVFCRLISLATSLSTP